MPLLLAAILLCAASAYGQEDANGVSILDSRHYSNVFGEPRNYRVFLPPGYHANETKRYPVIYFFHGWSQRYFGSSNPYGDFDRGEDNGGDNIANFVARNDVIVVKADGYNRSADEPYYVRPYNVSPVETYRQFPEYFPELIRHVDTEYRTLADRNHRGISGLSMGGFMTMWLSGKYPHLVSAAGNFCGSAEFMVGPKDFPVEYRHLDMYNNYGGVNVRLHYGNKDFIRDYHHDMNNIWTQVLDNYSYGIFDAGHSTCGMGEMFSFILDTFKDPPAKPDNWSHIDVYPRFEVWEYEVSTDRTLPGFTAIENVNSRGFRISVREFLPDGPQMPFVNVTVKTPPLYEKNQLYIVNDIEIRTGKSSRQMMHSDSEGRLVIHTNGAAREVGINKSSDKANLTVADYTIEGAPWATHKKEVQIAVRLINKGNGDAQAVTATITPVRPTSKMIRNSITFGDVPPMAAAVSKQPFIFRVDVDSLVIARFEVKLRDARRNSWTQYIDVPLTPTVPEMTDFVIADGKMLAVAGAGIHTDTLMLGHGNGDGVANPGESIVILAEQDGKLWRTDLTFADKYLNPHSINERHSDNWTRFDHVGGSAKYDVPLIASDCPSGHTLEFVAEYWMPEYPMHNERRGLVRIEVRGTDTTPPRITRIHATGDNVLHATIIDGAPVTSVRATLVDEKNPDRRITLSLADEGKTGDRVAGDHVFSQTVPPQVFGIFKVVIEAEDATGNKAVVESDRTYVFH